MGRYRTINVDLNRQYRNDLNKNFEDIEKDIVGAESYIARVEAESKERDNLMAGTDVATIIQRIDTSASNADVQAQHAKTQGDYAKVQGDYAKSQGDYARSKGDYADEKAILADQAAANANSESGNLSQLKIDVTNATQNANTATDNANTATTNANNSATYATEQGDYAKQEADRIAGMDVGQLTTKVNELETDVTTLQSEFAIHVEGSVAESKLVTRSSGLVGQQTIVFEKKVNALIINTYLAFNNTWSRGIWTPNNSHVLNHFNDGSHQNNIGYSVMIGANINNYVQGAVSVVDNVVTIQWTHVGTPPENAMQLSIMAITHSGGGT